MEVFTKCFDDPALPAAIYILRIALEMCGFIKPTFMPLEQARQRTPSIIVSVWPALLLLLYSSIARLLQKRRQRA